MLVDTLIDYRIQTVLQLQIEKQEKKSLRPFCVETIDGSF